MTVYPLVLHIGSFSVTGFGLMMMLAFIMSGWAIQLELRRRGLDEEYAADIVIAAVLGGLAGAKIWYWILTGGSLFSRGGFVWYGGFLGGVAGVIFNSWRRRVPIAFTADLVAPALTLGYAIGRVGCFVVGDDYGRPSSLPWAVRFPEGLPATTVANLQAFHVAFPAGTNPAELVAVHPTQVYETTLMLLATAWLWKHRDHRHATGWLFACYLVIAGAERFAIEFLRAKDDRFLNGFTIAQATSLGLIAVGAYLLVRWRAASPADSPTVAPASLAKQALPSGAGLPGDRVPVAPRSKEHERGKQR
ncbi:MAG TPA: prolipoprotein diacylglyceryl transferase [Gemmatimonadales bacterium]|nr:prolipoprotein diacylglyceryl transferase [Gemmatimonadales bacterium]